MFDITQKTVLFMEKTDVKDVFLSVPFWDELSDPSHDANKGFVRHGGVEEAMEYVPRAWKPPYAVHVQNYLTHIDDPIGKQPKTLLVFGTRNTFQNLGLPGWCAAKRRPLLRRLDEPWQSWTYHAFCKLSDGQMGIEEVKFVSTQSNGEPDSIVFVGSHQGENRKVEWAIVGQPVLWDGAVPPLEQMVARTYDLRHIWHLGWERWQREKWCAFQRHKEIHDALMTAFMTNLNKSVEDRANALKSIAEREHLAPEDRFLHSSLGVKPDGSLVVVMMHGSLRDVGCAHQSLGSQRVILLDNGGSVGVAYWSQKTFTDRSNGTWGTDVTDRPSPTATFGNGTYFRPRGHATVVVELKEDIVERPFRP